MENSNDALEFEDASLETIDATVEQLNGQISTLTKRRDQLLRWRDQLVRCVTPERESLNLADIDHWTRTDYPWSAQILNILREVFHFESFRKAQLAAINATLSEEDVILVSPTGGGKSLVFQLTAVYNNKLTLVVSPLLSLIEDQLLHLSKLKIEAAAISGHTSKQTRNKIHAQMIKYHNDATSRLKLLYVTPEWIAKSKQFMSYLQKCYDKKLLARIVIDEVHCCSTWGHDFRPDYNYLSLLKTMFPKVPILGLTATAGKPIIKDVIEILTIPKTIILMEPFDRPNLFYRIKLKVEKEEMITELVNLMKNKFKGSSGIIYVMTVKESEEIAHALHLEGLKVKEYHGQLENDYRKKIQERWNSGRYQAVVATIAFGMGIDKPDVRFVIHASMPKSIEGLYQESGRAGRDGNPAYCYLFYSLNDFLKNVAMAMSKKEEERNYSVLEYCISRTKCRRILLAKHLDETSFPREECGNGCDNCVDEKENLKCFDVSPALIAIRAILAKAETLGESKLTLLKLISAWFKTGPKPLRNDLGKPDITKEQAEDIIAYLICQRYLGVTKGYNLYSALSYIINGIRSYKKGSINMPYLGDLPSFMEVPLENDGDESMDRAREQIYQQVRPDLDTASGSGIMSIEDTQNSSVIKEDENSEDRDLTPKSQADSTIVVGDDDDSHDSFYDITY